MRLRVSVYGALLLFILFLTVLVSGTAAKEIENLLKNPDFEEGIIGWSIGAEGLLSIDKKEKSPTGHPVMLATINAAGAENWNPEIHSPAFDVELGKQYTIDFYTKTEPKKTRPLGVKFEQLETWTGPSTTVNLNGEWQQIVYSPVMTVDSPPQVVIHMQFNKLLEDVWFSHFRVYEGKFVEEEIGGKPKIAVVPMARLATVWGSVKTRY